MYWRSLFLFKSVLPFICMLSLALAYILSSPSSHAQQTNIPFVAQAPVPFSEANLWQQISVTEKAIWLGSRQGTVVRLSTTGAIQETHQIQADYQVRRLIAEDDLHSYALLVRENAPDQLYQTRNGGYSWRRLFQTRAGESLGCMAVDPEGEAWILGDSQSNHWFTVRSNNGRHWNSNRSGFSQPPLPHERVSLNSDHCGRFKQETWAFVTQSSQGSRLVYKNLRDLRFQVVALENNPIFIAEAVWPVGNEHFLIAGAQKEQGKLLQYQSNSLSSLTTPLTQNTYRVLYQANQQVFIGNEQVFYQANAADVYNNQAQWQAITDLDNQPLGVLSMSCYQTECWFIDHKNQLRKLSQAK